MPVNELKRMEMRIKRVGKICLCLLLLFGLKVIVYNQYKERCVMKHVCPQAIGSIANATDCGKYVNSSKHVDLGPQNNIQTIVNNVSLYIEDVLRKIKVPKERLKERKSLTEYNDTRNKIIAMLPRLTKQNSQTTFHVLVDKTKKLISSKYHLVVLISSYAVNWEERRNIRRLWGNHTTSINKNWEVFFITGGVTSQRDMETLYREAIAQKDVIIEDFMESWSLNMGRKVMTGLQWATSNFMYDYVLKTDDDVFVDIDAILSILRKKDEYTNKDIYMGNVMEDVDVVRGDDRYAVHVEEYNASIYEPYCSGGGYVLSKTLIKKMIPVFQWEHPLRIDDAYIGGRVIRAGGRAENEDGFKMWNDNCTYDQDLLVTHPASEECMEKLHRIIVEKKKSYL